MNLLSFLLLLVLIFSAIGFVFNTVKSIWSYILHNGIIGIITTIILGLLIWWGFPLILSLINMGVSLILAILGMALNALLGF